MALRQIVPIDHLSLREPSAPVDLAAGVPEDIVTLATDMLETSRAIGGAGMAAVQVGEPIRMFIMDLVSVAGDTIVFINPEIVWRSEETVVRKEGCLSMPGVMIEIARPAQCRVTYTDLKGRAQTYEADGFAAQCVQHEIDHLDGVRMIDGLSPLKRAMVLKQFEKAKARQRVARR